MALTAFHEKKVRVKTTTLFCYNNSKDGLLSETEKA